MALLLFITPKVLADAECLAVEQAFASNEVEKLAALTLQNPQWQALQQFRLAAIYIPAEQNRLARQAVKAGLVITNKALQTSPDNVEMLLLGAMLDGQMLLISPWRFLHNGRRGLKRLRSAERLDHNNPRAALIRGTALVVLPAFFGGNARSAQQMFAQALTVTDTHGKRFADSELCSRGAWAQVDLLNWLGRAHAKLDEHAAAAAAYQQALQRSPDNHWVQLAIEGRGYNWDNAPEPDF
ncbi:MAG: hypothetical protein AAF993_07140 [Pseudomonadota bacterium]